MHKTWILIKTMLKMQYSKAGGNSSQIWLLAIVIIFSIPLLALYIGILQNLISELYNVLQPLGQDSIIPGLLFLSIHMLLFLISLITVISAFYFAEDIESFIPFPLKAYQLLLGKAASPFLYLYLTSGAFFLPAFFIYGMVSDASLIFYFYGIILFILLPIIPFTVASILLMIVMRFVNIAKNKDRSKVLAGIFSLAFIIFINVVIRLNTNSNEMMADLAKFIQEKDGLLQMATSFYPPALFSTRALNETASSEGFLFFLLMIGLSLGAFFLFIWLGELFYLKGVLGLGSGNKRKISQKKMKKQITARPVWLAYIQKEIRIILRTPTFLMQCVIQSLFGPIFILILLMLDTANLSGFMNLFSEKHSILMLFIATLLILGGNATSISSISREGKSWHANLFLPLATKQIFYSKILTAWLINLLSIILILIIFIWLLHVPGEMIIIWLILALVANWFTSSLGTYLDFLKPKLNWTDEQEIFKARMIAFIALLLEAGIFGIIVLILWNIGVLEGLYTTSFILFLCLMAAIFTVQLLLNKKIKANEHQHI